MKVVYTQRFRRELADLELYAAGDSSIDTALRYTDDLMTLVQKLAVVPKRYPLRPEPGPGVRVPVNARAVRVAYRPEADCVRLLAPFGRGQALHPLGTDA